MKHSPFISALDDACRDLPPLSDVAREQLATHWDMVKQWNKRINLTAIVSDREAAFRHYRDSLEAVRLLPPGPVVDFGSGAGFPGLPIAVAEPDRRVTLVEPRRKRVSFLEASVARLGLKNVSVFHGASTDLPPQSFAAGVTRATFSDPADFEACLNWLTPGAPLIAFRTQASGLSGTCVHPYTIDEQPRVLEIFTRSS